VHPPFIIYHDAFWYPYWWYPFYVYGTYSEPYGLSYDELGKQWGKDLKRGTVTMEEFVAFLQAQVVNVPDPLRTDFEHGYPQGLRQEGRGGLRPGDEPSERERDPKARTERTSGSSAMTDRFFPGPFFLR